MKSIALSKGYTAIIDDEDFERVGAHSWSAAERPNGRVYAVRNTRIAPKTWRQILMHRDILGVAANGRDIDHANRDGLDNRRANLRVATRSENNANQRPQVRQTSSQYKGVTWRADKRKWRATIKRDRRTRFLGYFTTEEAAAAAYDSAAREIFGPFARLNGAFDG